VPRLSIDPFSDGFLADPYEHHDLLRDAGPVFWLERHGIYGAARHAEVSAALKDWQNFCSGRGVGLDDFAVEEPWRPPSLLLETDPPVHDRTRSLMNSVVGLSGLKALTPLWRTKAEALADRLVAQRHFDAVADLAEAYPLSIFPDTSSSACRRWMAMSWAGAGWMPSRFGPLT
jgi:cytochrome P450